MPFAIVSRSMRRRMTPASPLVAYLASECRVEAVLNFRCWRKPRKGCGESEHMDIKPISVRLATYVHVAKPSSGRGKRGHTSRKVPDACNPGPQAAHQGDRGEGAMAAAMSWRRQRR